MTVQQDTLKKRYIYKVIANVITGAAGVVTQALISRGLGVVQYGNFNFLTDFFAQFLAFLNAGTSTAFYTKLSKRPQESKLVVFYMAYIHVAAIAALLIAGGIILAGGQTWVWPGQQVEFVLLALLFAAVNWFYSSMNDMVDAYGLTVRAEKVKALQRLAGIVVMVGLFGLQWINMRTVFGFNYGILLISIGSFIYISAKHHHGFTLTRLTKTEIKGYLGEFYSYSKPMMVFSLFGLGIAIFDRWFLQVVGGGVQQGFYSLSFKISAICFLLTGAMTQLIMREFSVAHAKHDVPEMARLFRRHIPLLYGITAIISCFICVNADKVSIIIGGKEFKEALIPVALMALYPIHQTYGQLSSAVFFATDQTRLYCNVSAIALMIGVPLTYVLLAQPSHGGLGMGAIGLALKMVIANILTNNVLLYFNAKYLRVSFGWYLGHQIVSVLTFLLCAFIVTWGLDQFLSTGHILLRFLLAGVGYLVVTAAAVKIFPGLLGLRSADIDLVLAKVKGFSRSA